MFLRARPLSAWRLPRAIRCYSARSETASFPIIPSCPSPTCSCAPTPEMPKGFLIDHSKPLNGTMAAYAEQILICTGKDDWPSRIEEENSGDNLAADIKELLGRGGTYSDPYHNVSVLNSSFPSSVHPRRHEVQTNSAYLFPSFKYVPYLPRVSFESVQALVKGYVLPSKLHSAHNALSPVHRDRLVRNMEYRELLPPAEDVQDIMVLICGHGGRDIRCGITGPILRAEFRKSLERIGIGKHQPLRETKHEGEALDNKDQKLAAGVGLISHIGGHKFAGNVIVYLPPHLKLKGGEPHPLAGCGIWYGRVEPRHVEGIVKATILEGKVVEDMFRGGIRQGGEVLRI